MSVALGIMALCTNVSAKPIDWGDDDASPKWANNKQINIFIPEHPQDGAGTANDEVKTGIERWADKITTPYGITFNILLRDPQKNDPTGNRVVVEWVDDDSLDDPDAEPPKENEGKAEPHAAGTSITGATIKIEKDNKTGDYLKNLGMHEFGHVLGLGDDTTADGQPHNVMDHIVESTGTMSFSARDNKEIESLYGTAADKEQADGGVEDSSQSIEPGIWEYQYFVSWTAGPEIPIFEVWIGAHPAEVVVTERPPGWALDYPPELFDCIPIPTPTPETRKLHFYAVDPNATFDMDNQGGRFVIQAPFPPGPGTAHAMIGGQGQDPWTIFDVDVPRDAAIPSVSAWGLIIMTLTGVTAGAILFGRRHWRRPATA